MVLAGAATRSNPSTHQRWRGAWLLLLVCGACKLPSYGDYIQPTQSIQLQDAGADACDGGGCAPSCAAGLADCNGRSSDGCEASLDSTDHCGGCAVECTNEHGTTACAGDLGSSFSCAPACAPGFADCDLDPSNGCETDLNTDSTHCGRCGLACPANGGTPRCQAGECGVSSCNPGFGDCKNAGACGQNLNTDPSNCGHCGHVCSSARGTASCNGGTCQIACEAGWGDCNGGAVDAGAPPDDGCETKLDVPDQGGNVPNCGTCGALCTRRAFTTVNLAQCAQGVCARDCFVGEGDCDGNRDVPACTGKTCGCETALGGDVNNCGACAHVCKGGGCANDKCDCPDGKPTSGSTKCTLASSVKCGSYETSCTCTCSGGVFKCTDAAGQAC